jgi:hypothetical protein
VTYLAAPASICDSAPLSIAALLVVPVSLCDVAPRCWPFLPRLSLPSPLLLSASLSYYQSSSIPYDTVAAGQGTVAKYAYSNNNGGGLLAGLVVNIAASMSRQYSIQFVVQTGDSSEVALTSGAASSAFSLTAGAATTILVSSSLDGTYAFMLRRASLSLVSLLCASALSANADEATPDEIVISLASPAMIVACTA